MYRYISDIHIHVYKYMRLMTLYYVACIKNFQVSSRKRALFVYSSFVHCIRCLNMVGPSSCNTLLIAHSGAEAVGSLNQALSTLCRCGCGHALPHMGLIDRAVTHASH